MGLLLDPVPLGEEVSAQFAILIIGEEYDVRPGLALLVELVLDQLQGHQERRFVVRATAEEVFGHGDHGVQGSLTAGELDDVLLT